MEDTEILTPQEPLNEVITFDPPLLTVENRIDGNALISEAEVLPPDCEEKYVVRLTGSTVTPSKPFQSGMVIAVPNIGPAKDSIIAALT